VVVQQHLGGQGSMLVQILRRRTALPIDWADDGSLLEPGQVLVARPGRRLEVLPDGTVSSFVNDEGARAHPTTRC
jgi:chemotaxis response regulator CheB